MKDHEQRARKLIAEGKTIEAIKVWREATGLGLAEAKAAVEHIERTGKPPAKSAPTPADVPLEVADLARRGETAEAIKRLRDRRNLSLDAAKRIVKGLPVDPGARKSGCLGAVLGALGLGAALLGS